MEHLIYHHGVIGGNRHEGFQGRNILPPSPTARDARDDATRRSKTTWAFRGSGREIAVLQKRNSPFGTGTELTQLSDRLCLLVIVLVEDEGNDVLVNRRIDLRPVPNCGNRT